MVKDINPGSNSSYPYGLTNVSGTLFFAASDGSNGTELWESNGTSSGTYMVKDIHPGPAGSYPFYLTNVGGALFFGANDGSHGSELWALAPPQLAGISQSTTVEGSAAFTLTLTGSNFDSTATVLWNGAPLTTVFQSATQLQAKVTASLVAEEGSATVAVTEDNGTSNDLPFTITDAPLALTSVIAPVGATEGSSTGPFIVVANFTDRNTTTIPLTDFTAVIQWGDGTTSTVTSKNGDISGSVGSYVVEAAHTYAEEINTPTVLSVQVLDEGGASASASSSPFTVADAPLTLTPINAPAGATEGTSTDTFTVATFTDGNTGATASDFRAIITWGDGSTSTLTAANGLSGSAGRFAVVASHTFAEEITTATVLSVQVRDAGGASASGSSSTFTVADAPVTLTAVNPPRATEGASTGTFTVATFTDGNPKAPLTDFTAIITWGDGSSSAVSGSGIVAQGGTFAVLVGHTYADEGTFTLSVQVRDVGGASVSDSLMVSAADAPLSNLTLTSIQAIEGKSTGTLRVASFHDSNLAAAAADFTAAIAWGDGSTTTVSGASGGIVSLGNGNFAVNAGHTYAEEGSFTLAVQVRDDGGSGASAARGLSAVDAALSGLGVVNPHATEGKGTGTFTVATFIDHNAAAAATDFTAVVRWGDGTTTTVTGGIVALGGGKFAVRASHTYAEEGSYALSVRVRDDGAAAISGTLTIAVADAPLGSLSVKNPNARAGADTGTFTVATFHDANVVAPTGDFTATVNWGDGTSSTIPAADIVSLGNGNFAVLADHTYAAQGTYTLSVQVGDVGAASINGKLKISVAPG
jgi:ELWxxDGT repeat protein